MLSAVNLDAIPEPVELGARDVVLAMASIAVLIAATRHLLARAPVTTKFHEKRGALLRFGCAWAVIGWLPMLVPTIGWHAYYAGLGALGAWLVMAVVLAYHRGAVIAVLAALILLRTASAASLSWDWGSAWYQKRAGYLLSAMRERLLELHATVPSDTRFYFGRIPNNVGLISGSSPAVRVWYRDTTLTAEFYSSYRPRRPDERSGSDLFFRFDSVQTLVEITNSVPGNADQATVWGVDQLNLAMLLLRAGDIDRAGHQFATLSKLPTHPEARCTQECASLEWANNRSRTPCFARALTAWESPRTACGCGSGRSRSRCPSQGLFRRLQR